MKILGIESSCDETACAVVEDGRKVLSNIVATSLEEHKLYGGVVPEIASRRHAESISGVVKEALEKADCTMDDIEAIAVTYAPGLIGALLVGVNFAKGLSFATGTPLVPVHHLRGHIASNYISSDVKPPFLCLVVSGGHSHIVAVNDYTDFEIIGKTRDDAAGEALDKAGRTMGLAYPGGISIDKISKQGNENAFKFPHPRVTGSEYDFSFSGLKTSVINTVHNAKQKSEEINIPDLAASFQKSVVDCLIQNLEKAAIDKNFKKIHRAVRFSFIADSDPGVLYGKIILYVDYVNLQQSTGCPFWIGCHVIPRSFFSLPKYNTAQPIICMYFPLNLKSAA